MGSITIATKSIVPVSQLYRDRDASLLSQAEMTRTGGDVGNKELPTFYLIVSSNRFLREPGVWTGSTMGILPFNLDCLKLRRYSCPFSICIG